jgi:hypothetical protein
MDQVGPSALLGGTVHGGTVSKEPVQDKARDQGQGQIKGKTTIATAKVIRFRGKPTLK